MLPCPLCPYAAGPGASPQPERRYCNLGQDPADFSDNYHTSVRPTRLFLRGHSGQDRLLRCRRRRVPSQTGQTYQGQQASQSRGILDRIGQDRATKRANEHTSSSSTCLSPLPEPSLRLRPTPYACGHSAEGEQDQPTSRPLTRPAACYLTAKVYQIAGSQAGSRIKQGAKEDERE